MIERYSLAAAVLVFAPSCGADLRAAEISCQERLVQASGERRANWREAGLATHLASTSDNLARMSLEGCTESQRYAAGALQRVTRQMAVLAAKIGDPLRARESRPEPRRSQDILEFTALLEQFEARRRILRQELERMASEAGKAHRARLFVPRSPLPSTACDALGMDNGSNAAASGAAQADATAPRPIPCSVQAHGIDAVQARLQQRPQREPCDDSVNAQTVALDELIRIIPDQHPSFYYVLATRLFEAGRKDEAVFWFYAGQLRYRSRLACHPELPPGTEPALFASLQEVAGTPINEHAGADPDAWIAAMERARAWDETNRNGFEPREPCRAAIADSAPAWAS